ncbi:hypothetical protein NL676_032052 [Syzygium grande]|nr:hypothetical protein NL676_032052 [Syzygium grande]
MVVQQDQTTSSSGAELGSLLELKVLTTSLVRDRNKLTMTVKKIKCCSADGLADQVTPGWCSTKELAK